MAMQLALVYFKAKDMGFVVSSLLKPSVFFVIMKN